MNENLQRLQDEATRMLVDRRNWDRWGPDDQLGAMNLITPEKRLAAAALVKSGRSVSLSRPFPKTAAPNNPYPAQHWMAAWPSPEGGGAAIDYYATPYHGAATTHLDALCHMWGLDGLWNGRRPEEVTPYGARWGGIENWSSGIVTRGVLLDVPKFRGEPYATVEKPVTGPELAKVASSQGVVVQPGDALAVYAGREAYERTVGPWGVPGENRPGLHASCLAPIRDWDVSVLLWDMMDLLAAGHGRIVHGAICAFGVGLVDGALLEPLAQACAEEGTYEFMFVLAPLVVQGGTGSPVNPIAIL